MKSLNYITFALTRAVPETSVILDTATGIARDHGEGTHFQQGHQQESRDQLSSHSRSFWINTHSFPPQVLSQTTACSWEKFVNTKNIALIPLCFRLVVMDKYQYFNINYVLGTCIVEWKAFPCSFWTYHVGKVRYRTLTCGDIQQYCHFNRENIIF